MFVPPDLFLSLRHFSFSFSFPGSKDWDVTPLISLPVIRAIHVTVGLGESQADAVAGARARVSDAERAGAAGVLLDAKPGKADGGSGVTFDWSVACAVRDGQHVPLWLAGGLSPANAHSAVTQVRPWAVDVSSGVESEADGEKDLGKIRAFVSCVQDASEAS